MARRGAKPTPPALRLIEGRMKPDKVSKSSVARARAPDARARATFGPVQCPKYFGPTERKAWEAYIAPSLWLDRSREPIAIMFCQLWAQYQVDPTSFHIAKHREMRACMAELGLTDERNRVGNPEDANEEGFFS